MECKNCGMEINDDVKYCRYCGIALHENEKKYKTEICNNSFNAVLNEDEWIEYKNEKKRQSNFLNVFLSFVTLALLTIVAGNVYKSL